MGLTCIGAPIFDHSGQCIAAVSLSMLLSRCCNRMDDMIAGLGGVGGVVGAYYSELFPDRIRAYAGGFCFNMGRIGAIIAPFTVGHIGRIYGLQTGLACTVVIFLLGAITLLFLPETLEKKAS